MLQSPLIQDGGNGTSSRNTRLVKYRIATDPPTLLEQYVVQLPSYTKDDVENVAVQNAILQVTDTQYLMLTTDEGAGAGLRDKTSAHRRIEIFDLAEATKLAPETQARGPTIANPDTGVLNEGIQAGESCKPWLDINDAKELAKFGLYNGNVAGAGLLNEKWEGLAAVPVNDGNDGEYFLFVSSDNGFRTRTGMRPHLLLPTSAARLTDMRYSAPERRPERLRGGRGWRVGLVQSVPSVSGQAA